MLGRRINKSCLSSSYEYTMGFDVSAQVDNRDSNKLSTRDRLSSLLSSNKFSLSVRRSLALYDFYRHFTMSQKSDKATRIAVKTTGARLFLSSTPPHLCNKINELDDNLNLLSSKVMSFTGVFPMSFTGGTLSV